MNSPIPSARKHSLKGRIWLLVAALAAPLLLLQGWWSFHDVLNARDRAEENALAVADAAALGVDQFLSSSEQMMGATAAAFADGWLADGSCQEQIQTAVRLHPFLLDALAVDADGTIVCSARNTHPSPSVARWPWWRAAKATSDFVLGRPGDLGDGWVVPLATPVLDDTGGFAGGIVGLIDPVLLSDLIGVLASPTDRLITLATGDRSVITRSEDAEMYLGQPLPPLTGSERELTPGRWSATGPDLNGIPRMWGQVETDTGWIVYVGVPRASVYGPALAESARHIGTTLFVLLLGMSFAAHSYRKIARSLEQLATGAKEIAGGDVVPLPQDTPEEVSVLVNQFNDVLQARDRAQASERHARERFESLFNNAVFGLCVSTADGRFLQVNPALTEMLGYPSVEALLDAGPEALYADPAIGAQHLDEAFEAGAVTIRELDWLCADGRLIAVRLGGKLIQGPGGEPVLEMIVQDITDAKRIEDELRHTQKMDAIGQLAGGVAHDFNNLLTVIGGNVELLEDDLPTGDPLQDDLAQISKATTRATSLTKRLLSFSRSERRGTEVRDVNVDILELKKLLMPLIGEDVILGTSLTEEPLPVRIDPSELEQILLNLVLNSRDAMPHGGTLTIKTERAVVGGSGVESEGARISVVDSGVGIDEASRGRIFEPFYTTKPLGRGTGLGLSTVYGIVKRMDGQVQVESVPGVGTTIHVTLPLTTQPATAPGPSRAEEAPRGDERILVVEDDALVRRFVERALSDAGYTVATAVTGEEALDAIRTSDAPPHLVLSDVVMPIMTGPELAEKLALIQPDVPVLFMSGYVDQTFLGRELENHPEQLLRKPFATAELRRRVRDALDRRQPVRVGR